MPPDRKMPDCPRCGDNRQVYEDGDRYYWCRRCNVGFDAEDDGDIGSGRPDREAMKREERAIRERKLRRRGSL